MRFVVVAAVVAVVIVLAGVFVRSGRAAEPSTVGLRKMALTTEAAKLGITPRGDEPWEVVMDLCYPTGCVSVVALSDGNASLYLSTGGGVIGGGAHETVAKAAKAFVHESGKHLPRMKLATDMRVPTSGMVRFFVRTRAGVFTYEAGETDLGSKNDQLWPLFYAGQELLTQLRLMTGQK